MKKLCLTLILLPLLLLPAAKAPAEDGGGKKLTLMIYMCGSNLESAYGSGTADMMEMLRAKVNSQAVSVLVMTGGSAKWQMGIDPAKASISEIGSRGMRPVWRSDRLNMGEKETLTHLLRFGIENYPADSYALILWDHGGGPLEGVCWDELFSLDHLSLKELADALEAARLEKKLSWIGFDACLMSSVEVAYTLAPYAEYMIASQETEPAKGWDYAFLKDIENDADGAATGRRIIDSYFDSLGGSGEILTMACIDLQKIGPLSDLMSEFFYSIGAGLDENDFPRLSALRMSAASFGKAVRGIGDSGYDLVDLKELIARYSGGASALSDALGEAVVYCRSTEEGANGLSVYHPYYNKEKYLDAWRADYRTLKFCSGYALYVNQFGALLTGDRIADWRGLDTVSEGTDGDGVQHFSLQLTPEQRDQFSSAQLLILASVENLGWTSKTYSPIAVEEVNRDENGLLTAAYGGRSLYVADENNSVLAGPVSFLLSEDGTTYTILAQYTDDSGKENGKNSIFVLHKAELDEETGDLRILRSLVYDDASQTYTNRIGFSEEGYTKVYFYRFLRNMPSGRDPLPAYDEWESFNGVSARGIGLPSVWHLHMFDGKNMPYLYAAFQIADLQQNVYSSPLLRLENPTEKIIALTPDTFDTGEGMGRITALLMETDTDAGCTLTVAMENPTGVKMTYRFANLILNGHRMAPFSASMDMGPGEKNEKILSIPADALMGFTEINQIDLRIELYATENPREEHRYYSLHAQAQGWDVSRLAARTPEPLAEAESGGISWKLLSVGQDRNGNVGFLMHVFNDTDEAFSDYAKFTVGPVLAELGVSVDVHPHTDRFFRFSLEKQINLTLFDLSVSGRDTTYWASMDQLAELAADGGGISRIDLFFGLDAGAETEPERLTFQLAEPVKIETGNAAQRTAASLLEGGLSVVTEGAFVGDDGAALAVRFRNDTDQTVVLTLDEPRMNGSPDTRLDYFSKELALPAHTSANRYIVFKNGTAQSAQKAIPDSGALEQVSFRFIRDKGGYSTGAVIRFPAGTVLGTPEGLWLPAETLDLTPAVFEEKAPLISEQVTVAYAGEARLIFLTAPLTPEEQAGAKWVKVQLCFLGSERREENGAVKEYLTVSPITSAVMARKRGGEFTAALSGLAVKANGHVLCMEESRGENDVWELEQAPMGGTLFFYADASQYHPTDGAGLYLDTECSLTSILSFSVHVDQEGAKLTGSRIEYAARLNSLVGRKRFYLEEAEAAYSERRVLLGTNRSAGDAFSLVLGIERTSEEQFAFDRMEEIPLELDRSISLELIPVERLEGRLCLYYLVLYSDYSRGDRIVDWETGGILETRSIP